MERLTDRSTYSNHTEVFATHLHLEVELDFEKKVLSGTVVHTLDVVPGVTSSKYIVDTRVLDIVAVLSNGKPVRYTMGETTEAFGTPLEIDLGAPIKKGDSVSITYVTAPGQKCPGALFLEPEQTANGTHPFYFTQGQAILARSIVPCQDTPARKVTYSANVTVPSPMTAVMSATTIAKPEYLANNKVKFAFEQTTCIPTYLITLAAGVIERRDISDRCAVWAEPSLAKKAAWEFGEVEKYLSTAEKLCGKYVWGRYDIIVLPPAFPYGGMENPQLTFVTPTLLTGDRSKVNVIIHEIAHSWSGNLVTNATWEDFWLNEGFTVFTERAVLHEIEGVDAFNIHAEMGWRDLVCTCCEEYHPQHDFTKLRPCLSGIDPDDAFSKIPYEKGFALLLTLQQNLYPGQACTSLYPFLRYWFHKFAYKTVDFNDFKATLEEYFSTVEKNEEALQYIQAFNWAEWITEPGVPKQKPIIDPTPVDRVFSMADRFAQDPNLLSKLTPEELAMEGFTPDLKYLFVVAIRGMQTEKEHFNRYLHRTIIRKPAAIAGRTEVTLDECQTELLPHPCKALDDAFHFSETTDPDILHEWCMFCVQLDYQPIRDVLFKFLGAQGRIKYVKSLFQRLWKGSSFFRNLAREAFHCHVKKYHAVLAKGVCEIVEMDISQARGSSPFDYQTGGAAKEDPNAHLPPLPRFLQNKIDMQDVYHQGWPQHRKDARDAALRLLVAAHPGVDFDRLTPIGVGLRLGKNNKITLMPDQANSAVPEEFEPLFPADFPVSEELRAALSVKINKQE